MASMTEVRTLIATQLGVDTSEVTEDARIVDDLGAESSDVANIVAAIEDKFGVKVSEGDVQRFITVRDIYIGVQNQ